MGAERAFHAVQDLTVHAPVVYLRGTQGAFGLPLLEEQRGAQRRPENARTDDEYALGL